MARRRFSIHRFMEIMTEAYKTWRAPSVTLIAQNNSTPFRVLISTVLSLRTRDEVTLEASTRLFGKAETPGGMLELGEDAIRELIYPAGFYPTKAKRIIEISGILVENFDGLVPGTMEELLALPGVGRKTANLVLVEGFGIPAVCVDTHVHRISNRTGYVRTKNPEQTEFALREKLPEKYWVGYNKILVAFGQTICRPISPFCGKCPAEFMCRKIGVDRSR